MDNKTSIKGIIFDFNGTLFWDSELHDETWNKFAMQLRGRGVSREDLLMNIHGKINKDILAFVLEKEISDDEANRFSEEKEMLYRNLVLSAKEKYQLAPGAEELLDELANLGFPVTIATSSQKPNVDFYFDYFGLSKWFDYQKVVFDNGKIEPKPAPDIFIEAARKLDVDVQRCLILEDSFTGIRAARNACANKVVFVENNVPVHFHKIEKYVDGRISNLLEIKNYF
jgi:beta-phosphoglucomutase